MNGVRQLKVPPVWRLLLLLSAFILVDFHSLVKNYSCTFSSFTAPSSEFLLSVVLSAFPCTSVGYDVRSVGYSGKGPCRPLSIVVIGAVFLYSQQTVGRWHIVLVGASDATVRDSG